MKAVAKAPDTPKGEMPPARVPTSAPDLVRYLWLEVQAWGAAGLICSNPSIVIFHPNVVTFDPNPVTFDPNIVMLEASLRCRARRA